MAKEPKRHTSGPTTNTGSAAPGSGAMGQAVTPQIMWEQMCQVRGDLNKLSKVSSETLEVIKKTLEEMQDMNRQSRTIVEETKAMRKDIGTLTGTVVTMMEALTNLIETTQTLTEESKIASEQVILAAKDNRRAALDVQETVERLTLRNEQNIKQMSGDAEVLAQAAAITAIAQSENKTYVDAKKDADKQLADSVKFGQELKLWKKAVDDLEIEERVTKKFEERRKEIEES